MPKLNKNHDVLACVLLSSNPFGKKESFLTQIKKTYKIFGLNFFCYYSIKLLIAKIKNKNISKVLKKNEIPKLILNQSINEEKSLQQIKSFAPDLLISIAGNEIFRKRLIDLAPFGCLNLHTGFLPKYRGLIPTFWALKNNEKKIGITVFKVDEGIDSGPILVQKSVDIDLRIQSELIRKTKSIGMDCIVEAVNLIDTGKAIYKPNDDLNSSYYGFPKRSDVIKFIASGARFF